MNERTRRQSSNTTEIIILLAILVFANLISYYYFKRFDFTANQQYTISDATKRVLKRLDDPVTVDFFQSADLPPQLVTSKNEIRDKLANYAAWSGGNFKVRYTDPGDNEETKQKATSLGVPEFEVQVIERDQRQTKKVFCGLAMSYEDKSESIPIAIEPTNFEYELTSRLYKLTLDEKPKIGFFHGEFKTSEQQQAPGYEGIRQVLSGQDGLYELVNIDPQSDRQLPGDLDGLIISGTFGLSDSLKYSIDQFLLSGGQVLIALDPMMRAGQQQMSLGGEQAYPSIPTIEDQLEKYGIKFEKKLIADPSCGQAPVQTFLGTMGVPYPLWPKIKPDGFSAEVAAVAKLEALVVPYTCPLRVLDVQGVKFLPLASTSEQSFTVSSPFDLAPDQDWQFLSTAGDQGPFDVAYLLEGEIPTAFPDGPPEPPQTPEGEDAITTEPEFDSGAQLQMSNGDGRLILISSGSILSDNFLGRFGENVEFLQNTADMLLLGNELLEIRSTPVTARPLKQLSDAQKSGIRWALVLGVPALLVLFGLLLWFLKGRRRRAIQARYGG